MPEKFQNKYRIQSSRLQNWDYGSNAMYFVTICTGGHDDYFGKIIDCENNLNLSQNEMINIPTMQLNEIGQLAQKFWYEIPVHNPFVYLDAFNVMPNHLHGIIIIDKPINERNNVSKEVDTSNFSTTDTLNSSTTDTLNSTTVSTLKVGTVETLHATSLHATSLHATPPHTTSLHGASLQQKPVPDYKKMSSISPKKGTLSTIIRSYKAAVSRHARIINPVFSWQERFYDHIIRDRESLLKIQNYINTNPGNWEKDKFYK